MSQLNKVPVVIPLSLVEKPALYPAYDLLKTGVFRRDRSKLSCIYNQRTRSEGDAMNTNVAGTGKHIRAAAPPRQAAEVRGGTFRGADVFC